MHLPPPDPHESREPTEIELDSPIAVFLAGPPSMAADELASKVLEWRPGALLVVRR